MVLVAVLMVLAILFTLFELPALLQRGQTRELAVFIVLLVLGLGLGIAQALDLPVPNPAAAVERVYLPLTEFLFGRPIPR